MIRIEVISISGEPPPQPAYANFGIAGGTIGRASTNSLVLPDPSCLVSRVHAQIETTDSRCVITDQSVNALSVNSKPLGKGNSVELVVGDRIGMGPYLLEVKAVDGMHAGIPVISLPPKAAPPPAASRAIPLSPVAPPVATEDDPLADLLMAPAPSDLPPPPPPAPVPAKASTPTLPLPPEATNGLLPDDFDPMADPVKPPASRLPDDFEISAGFAPAGEKRAVEAAKAGPLASRGVVDPVPAGSPARPERPSELPKAAPLSAASPTGSFLSWDESQLGAANPKVLPAAAAPQAPAKKPSPAVAAPRAAARAGAPGSAGDSAGRGDALFDALIHGLGITQPDMPYGLTPELMERIGQLLREATRGTVEMLLVRATTKREIRAEATMIVTRGNNPLKFSPDVNSALTHLVSPLGPGFMAPLEALRDAYDDLRAHQVGVMAGMRGAFSAVLQQFSPQRLEERLTDKSFLDSLLPVNRRAKLWEQFHELYGEISQEAEEDFHTLFGREFLKAYELQIQRLSEDAVDQKEAGAPP